MMGPFSIKMLAHLLPEVREPSVPPGEGGTNLVNLVLARLSRGLPTDVITLDANINEPVVRFGNDLLRLWIVKRRPRKALRDGFAREKAGLLAALRESNASVCHANWTYEYGLAAVSQSLRPVVLTVHDHASNCLRQLGVQYLPLYLMTRYVLRRAQWTTAVSPYVAGYLEGMIKRSVPVIPNLLPETARQIDDSSVLSHYVQKDETQSSRPGQQSHATGRTIHIVSAVSWSRMKNVIVALPSIQAVRHRWLSRGVDIRYSLMGPGMEPLGAAHSWARDHDCADGVEFLGCLAYEQTTRLIRQSDILLHPSLEESFGMPVAEAMAMGVPVVACREAQGCRWLLGDGELGILVSGRRAESLAGGIDTAIQDKLELKAKSTRAIKHIRQLCDPMRVLEAYDNVYRQAIHGRESEKVESCS